MVQRYYLLHHYIRVNIPSSKTPCSSVRKLKKIPEEGLLIIDGQQRITTIFLLILTATNIPTS